MSKKKIKFSRPQAFDTFSNLLWFSGLAKESMLEIAAMNGLTCVCYLPTTPIQAACYFHVKEVIHA